MEWEHELLIWTWTILTLQASFWVELGPRSILYGFLATTTTLPFCYNEAPMESQSLFLFTRQVKNKCLFDNLVMFIFLASEMQLCVSLHCIL
ncbi:hypothetical protein RND71_019761 [Anisodus tanguticus]|uniref:Uncharacterized protein n=1 Tax=Anisodus tanguticus TaxID=243964 RepID=A0AAE1RXY2_9SOLA|nr:hypothetical protein RND71_019761 [Anisodus tanguticus]